MIFRVAMILSYVGGGGSVDGEELSDIDRRN
jgi:hypothetical protein